MRKTLSLMLLAIGCSLVAQAANPINAKPGSLQEGLAFYWDLNDGSTDYKTATGMTISFATGIQAIHQHATGGIRNSGYISSYSNPSRIDFYNNLSGANIKANAFTISLKISGLTADYRSMLCFSVGGQTFDLQTTNPGDGNQIALYSSGGGSTLLTGSNTNSLLKGTDWANVVLTSNGTNLTMYVNGLKVSSAFSPAASATLSNLQLSSKWGDGGRAADANYDDFAIWNRALNDSEISHLTAGGTAGDLIPEPATATLSLLGLAALMLRRRRIG